MLSDGVPLMPDALTDEEKEHLIAAIQAKARADGEHVPSTEVLLAVIKHIEDNGRALDFLRRA